ncbi:hypothetical protein [Clostridium sp. CM027]|nr:hypothetical protein [Clostridium sp. CM027]
MKINTHLQLYSYRKDACKCSVVADWLDSPVAKSGCFVDIGKW